MARSSIFINPVYWIYHVVAYDSRTGPAIVRHKGQAITVAVMESCNWAEGQQIDQARDCKKNASVAGNLDGRDVALGFIYVSKATESLGYLPSAVKDYWISVDTKYITLHSAERNLLEFWRIEKVEETN